MGVCSTTNYTSNVECCILQILCGESVIKEFNLPDLRVIDRDFGFILTDGVSTFQFDQYNILDVSAEAVRSMRCDCEEQGSGGATVEDGCCYYEVTRTELEDLVNDEQLIKGATYKITDRGDGGIFLDAVSESKLNPEGTRLQLIPNPAIFTASNVWNPANYFIYTEGVCVTYYSTIYQCSVETISNPFIDPSSNTDEWTLIPKTFPIPTITIPELFTGEAYILHSFGIIYDYHNDWISKQWDEFNNVLGYSYNNHNILSYNPVDVSDWYIAQNVNFGYSAALMFNNRAWGIINNRKEFGESNFYIQDNFIEAGFIMENWITEIIGNNIDETNYNVPIPLQGICLNGQKDNGDETYSYVYPFIRVNDNKGIFGNYVSEFIEGNVNNGVIYSVEQTAPISVSYNDNNGNIGGGTYGSDIFGTIVNL